MARKIFHSFRFKNDAWRVQTVRNIGAIEGQTLLTANQWEDVQRKGDSAIQTWIDGQLKGKSCVVVLIGSATAGRKWVNYEMEKGWADGKGVVGIHIHGLKDASGSTTTKGTNPLSSISVQTKSGDKTLSSVANTYNPAGTSSDAVYNDIKKNIESWIEEAVQIRNAN